MKLILVHGIGQNSSSWHQVITDLEKHSIDSDCPNLWDLVSTNITYQKLYQNFANYCNQQEGKLNLCGLSLGGILALNYASDFKDKVACLELIATPYHIPRGLFIFQNIVFHFMPKKTFEKMGLLKKDFINLMKTTSQVNIEKLAKNIQCDTYILCGEKDKFNRKNAQQLHKQIKKSSLELILNAKHEVNIDNPHQLVLQLKKIWKHTSSKKR